MNSGDQVRHKQFGIGSVEYDKGQTLIVRFEHGIEECESTSLQILFTPIQALNLKEWYAPLEVITRVQAEAIQSINDVWGIFSPSRIELLPHQLWVCRVVLEKWPTRWLVADDVGLGKTIEAGLILWPLLAKGTVKKLLVICPASLAEQWQYRLRTMFDIRLAQYVTEADTAKTDFWGTHNQVVASLQTLRTDRTDRQKERQARLFENSSWDLLIVDEAHHLNADEDSGLTLGYKLVKRLIDENRVTSVVFFTGTPHRGKNFGFLSLLSLLRPDLFNPNVPLFKQLPSLSNVMIRNNKQSVTDLKGKKLFQIPIVSSETFKYSESEANFYAMLTEFILTGKAYAASLSSTQGKAVMLVLIAMQKLASSSVAAIRRSLKGRFDRILEKKNELELLQRRFDDKSMNFISKYNELEREDNTDEINNLEEQIAETSAELKLMENEEQRLRELIIAANEVKKETKIDKIISILENKFANRTVLFFTEYKATQSLLMSALMNRFGNACVTFINGDGKACDIVDSFGKIQTTYESRESASDKFNSGKARFLVSTEAGGEGIDLQENCNTLIHVDLPWNPMRLHQRVGRLNRYGQLKQVEVISLRNPDTVESLIWDKLNEKISNIMQAFGQVMDEPEDLLQLVLGMTSSSSLFRQLFSEAENIPKESLSDWFDKETASFGGKDAIETVKNLVGNCSKFDFQQVSSQIPKLDLPALRQFLISMLILNNRRVNEDGDMISFKTPETWLGEPGMRSYYDEMVFDRQHKSKNAAQKVLGVGHKIINKALYQAKDFSGCVASIPIAILEHPIFIFRVYDRVTGSKGVIRFVITGVEIRCEKQLEDIFLRDWELLEKLNRLVSKRNIKKSKASASPNDIDAVRSSMDHAKLVVQNHIKELALPFKFASIEILAILWPMTSFDKLMESTEEYSEDEIM